MTSEWTSGFIYGFVFAFVSLVFHLGLEHLCPENARRPQSATITTDDPDQKHRNRQSPVHTVFHIEPIPDHDTPDTATTPVPSPGRRVGRPDTPYYLRQIQTSPSLRSVSTTSAESTPTPLPPPPTTQSDPDPWYHDRQIPRQEPLMSQAFTTRAAYEDDSWYTAVPVPRYSEYEVLPGTPGRKRHLPHPGHQDPRKCADCHNLATCHDCVKRHCVPHTKTSCRNFGQ